MTQDNAPRVEPRISVIVPARNAGAYLRQALRSAIDQEPPPHEIIVQDGGSSDDTRAVLESFGSRVAWQSEPDLGQSDALNKALMRATGEIILWLNADDEVLPGSFAAAASAFSSDPDLAWVYGDFQIINANGAIVRSYHSSRYSWDRVYRRGCYIFSGSIFVRREVLIASGGYDASLHACMDFDLLLRLDGAGKPRHLGRAVGRLRMHGGNKSTTILRVFLREAFRVRGRIARGSPRLWPTAVLYTAADAVSLVTTKMRYSARWPRHGRAKRL